MIVVGARDMSATPGPSVMSQTLAQESATRSITSRIPAICREDTEDSAEVDSKKSLELGQRPLRAAVKDRGHPDGLRALAVLAQVVHEHALLGRDPEPLSAQLEDLGLRLVEPDLTRDHDRVEELVHHHLVVCGPAPGIRDEPGWNALRPDALHGI